MYNWLSRNGYPVRQFTMGTEPQERPASAAPGSVSVSPLTQRSLNSAAARLGKRGRLTSAQWDALGALMHEGLHQMRFGRTPDVAGSEPMKPGNARWYEEGATEAASRDLLPIFARQMYGDAVNAPFMQTGYPGAVRNVRQLSVFGSGAKTYRDYKARVWRRQFLHADADGRKKMVDDATAARGAQ